MNANSTCKNVYNVLASGSSGNCVLYHNSIMVDIGVPYSVIAPYKNSIQIVLLTHEHRDHINLETLRRLCYERPTVRIGCCEWMTFLLSISATYIMRNVDIFDFGKWYDYGQFKIATGKLYHDVPNNFYRIEKNGYKIFHATDTQHLEGVTAKNYDLYAIEHNYDEDTIQQVIEEQESRGEFAHQRGSINSHLSEQQARDFFFKNRGENSKLIRLHESKGY